MGDIVIRKGNNTNFLFQVTGFDGNYVFLKGIKFPIMTISKTKDLIKLNRKRRQMLSRKGVYHADIRK